MISGKKSKLTNKWKEIEHTADVGIIAYGESFEEMFKNAAYGMLNISYGNLSIDSDLSLKVFVEENNEFNLLVSWLSEINYLTVVNDFIAHEIKSIQIEHTPELWKLNAELNGTQAANFLDFFNTEIKAVTYHQLKIEKKKGHYECQVIFDI